MCIFVSLPNITVGLVFSGSSNNNNSNNNSLSEEDFDLNEDHTPDLAKGEILCRALFLSVDPITRLYMKYGMAVGETFPGRQVARVVESRHRDIPKGKVNTIVINAVSYEICYKIIKYC